MQNVFKYFQFVVDWIWSFIKRIYNFELSIMSLFFLCWLCATNFETCVFATCMLSLLHFSCEWHPWCFFFFSVTYFHTKMIPIRLWYIITLLCCCILFASGFFVLFWVLFWPTKFKHSHLCRLGFETIHWNMGNSPVVAPLKTILPFICSFLFWFHLVLWLLPHIMSLKVFSCPLFGGSLRRICVNYI